MKIRLYLICVDEDKKPPYFRFCAKMKIKLILMVIDFMHYGKKFQKQIMQEI
ncbi:MAG: hypothetical protein ACR5K6_01310 [Wolbachia sp.]